MLQRLARQSLAMAYSRHDCVFSSVFSIARQFSKNNERIWLVNQETHVKFFLFGYRNNFDWINWEPSSGRAYACLDHAFLIFCSATVIVLSG